MDALVLDIAGKPGDDAWAPTPFLRGQYALAGLAARTASTLLKRPAPTTASGVVPGSSSTEERKVKLSHVISQGRDEEVTI
eukprot:5355075-Amphidinium_carterae.1